MTSHGFFYWNELRCGDIAAAKSFYGETLGWSYTPMAMDDGETYWIATVNGEPVCGLMQRREGDPDSQRPAQWISFIAVDDVDGRITKVEGAGGKLVNPVFEVPGVGRVAMVADGAGALIGWITPA